MPVLEAAGEGAVCLAIGEGRQDRSDPGAAGDAAGRDRLALATAHLATFIDGIN